MNIFDLLLYQPIINSLIFLYKILFSNLGLAIIMLTVIIRLILMPLMAPQLQSAQKMQALAPELEKLKKKFANDKQKLMQAQMELYKTHGINPASGCLPQIVQIVLLYALYRAFNQVISSQNGELIGKINEYLYPINRLPENTTSFNLDFLYLNLGKPDLIHIPGFIAIPGVFVILATIFQFLSSKMMMPQVKKVEKAAAKTENTGDDTAAMLQKQMLYMFPAMTLIFGYTMPSGVILYWFVFSLFSYFQQYYINRKKKGVVINNE